MKNKDLQNNWITDRLTRMGLSRKEATIYHTLLEVSPLFPSAIAKYARLNRSTVYALLQDLVSYGLVEQFEKNKKMCFQAEHPKNLLTFMKKRVESSRDHMHQAQELVPELESLIGTIPHLPRISFFEGPDGVEEVYRNHIEQSMPYEMVGYSNVAALQNFLSKRFFFNYVKAKERMKITSRGIFPDTFKDINYSQSVYRHINQKYLPLIKHIPKDIFSQQIEITMYGMNRISIINFNERVMVGIIIEDQAIHNTMRMIFDLVWNSISAL